MSRLFRLLRFLAPGSDCDTLGSRGALARFGTARLALLPTSDPPQARVRPGSEGQLLSAAAEVPGVSSSLISTNCNGGNADNDSPLADALSPGGDGILLVTTFHRAL